MYLNCLPFHSLDNNEFNNLFNNYHNINLNDSSLYFDPRCLSDSYNRDIDPDLGNSFGIFDKNSSSKYYDYIDLPQVFQHPKSSGPSLKVISQNIRSLDKNFEEFYLDIAEQNFDVIALCETWMSNDLSPLYADFQSYNGIFQNRSGIGGGVAFYVSKSISYDVIESFCFTESFIESIFVNFCVNGEFFIIGNIYRPPKGNLQEFTDKIVTLLESCKLNYSKYRLYIMGDLNINILKYPACSYVQNFVHAMLSYELCPMIRRPTRVSGSSATILDHIWTSDPLVECSGIIKNHITDHYSVFITSKIVNLAQKKTIDLITYRNYSETNKQKFRMKLNAISWIPLLSEENVDAVYSGFYSVLNDLFNECFPIEKRRSKPIDVQKPYIDDYIKGLIKEKRRIMKLYNKHPITYGDMYRDIRNKVNNVVQSSKRNYYRSHLAENERHPRTMWKTINEILGNNGKKNCVIQELKSSNGQITDNLGIS